MLLEEPIDDLHRESLDAIYYIRGMFRIAKAQARRWTPSPYPKSTKEET